MKGTSAVRNDLRVELSGAPKSAPAVEKSGREPEAVAGPFHRVVVVPTPTPKDSVLSPRSSPEDAPAGFMDGLRE